MSKASSEADTRVESWLERWQHWIAAIISVLLHLLFLFLMLLSSRINVTPPQGTAGGSRMVVDFIGATPPQPRRTTPAKPAARKPAAKRPAASRVQSTLVTQADHPLPPDADALAEEVPTPMPDDADDAAQDQAQAPAAAPPPTPQRYPHTWGQPPGMLPEDLAPENAGLARSSSTDRGRRNDASNAAPSMEVGGYQVYYDQRSETRLRAWRDQGMTEIFLPLPGTRRYMVCRLETALKRESGPCRLLEPDSPELKNIGDAREGINMQKVYRQGEEVWSGPGPYR
ncbi:MAG: type II toxin-antitoxin system RelE/ParE family toxin [Pseudoxanthomonas sp.]